MATRIILGAGEGPAYSLAMTSASKGLPNYLANVRQISEAQLSFAVTVPWILITLSQLFFSFVSDRLYSKTNSIIRSRVFVLGPVMIAGSVCYILGTMVSRIYWLSDCFL
ncbi:hypothetical protein IOC57_16410 [Bacillus sp. SD075]|uniref:hypothetical protein n=1 Tax=Bacillus sp. SD075 TaxID=2781732 RepID=UPI001A95AF9B|nr:hypothetical protein [Bacillus sp. SD075]MBO0999317.1 hypothetical protein [Bacillus sp. SD075]